MTTERLLWCAAALTLCGCVHTAPVAPKPQPKPTAPPEGALEQPRVQPPFSDPAAGVAVPGRVRLEVARSHWRREFEVPKQEQPPAGIERLVPDTELVTLLRCLGLERLWRTFAELERRSDSRVRVAEYEEWLKLRAAQPRRSNARDHPGAQLPTASSRFELKFPDHLDLTQAVEKLRGTPGVVSAEVVTTPQRDYLPNDPGYLAASAPGYDATLARGRWGFHNTGAALGAAYLDNFDIDAPEAWDTQRGDPSVVVAVFDTVIDVAHPDLYLNVFLNNGEVPPAVVAAHRNASTADGLPTTLTFHDLNQAAVVTALAASGWTDRNGNGRIDGEDVVAWWSDGTDADANGRVDDLVGWNFVAGNNRPFGPAVGCNDGHGTCAAGLIAAVADNGAGVAGVAHRVRFLPVTTALDIAEISYALSFPQVKAINHSYSGGFRGGTAAEVNALLRTLDPEGVLYVASLGNLNAFYYGGDPAQREPVVAVSNFQSEGHRARGDSSGYGPKTDVAAPAQGVYSTGPGGGTSWFGGTSGASPMTAGVAALLSSQSPTLSPEQLRQALRMTARDPVAVPGDGGENTPGWDLHSGWGLVNARSALAALTAGRIFAEANITSLYMNLSARARNEELAVYYGAVPVRAMLGLPAAPATTVSWTLRRSPSWDLSGAVVVRSSTSAFSADALLETIDTDPLDGRQVLELEVTAPGGVVSRDRAVIDLPRAYISNLRDEQLVIAPTTITGFAFGPGFARYRIQVAPGWTPAAAAFVDVSTSTAERRPSPIPPEPGLMRGTSDLGTLNPDSLPIALPASGQMTVRVRTEGARTWTYDAKVLVDNTHPPLRAGFPTQTVYWSNSAPLAVDLDADGRKEILIGGNNAQGVLNAVRSDGTAVPGFPVALPAGELLNQSFAAGDVDGDGRPEIVLRTSPADHREAVRVVRHDGTLVTAGWPATFDMPSSSSRPEQNPPVLADITRDGRLDILVGIERGTTVTTPTIRVFAHDGTVLRDYATGAADLEGVSAPAVDDLDGDGDPEVVAVAWRRSAPNRSTLYAWRLDGTRAWNVDIGPGSNFASNPVLLDIDGDRRLEVATAAGSGPLRVFRADGTPVSSTTLTDNYYRVVAAQLRPSVAAAEMSVLSAVGRTTGGVRASHVSAIDPSTGAERAGWSPAPVFSGPYSSGQPLVGDIQGDGALEVLSGNDPTFHPGTPTTLAAAASSGVLIADGQWPIPFPDGIQLTPLLSDLDADGRPELIVATLRSSGSFAGRLWVFNLPSSTHAGWLPWGEEGHDPRRSSNYHGDLRILSPNTARRETVGPHDDATLQGALVARVRFSRGRPSGDTTASNWRVSIGAVSATVREVSRVGGEHWLLVDPVVQPAPGPRMLRVEFDDGGIRTWDAYRDAVVYESPAPVHVVVPVIDDSGSMSTDGKMEAARVAARYFAESAYANDQVGVVAFNSTATDVLTGLRTAGTSRGPISGAISGLTAGGSTSIGSGLSLGLGVLGGAPTHPTSRNQTCRTTPGLPGSHSSASRSHFAAFAAAS